jgi:hypothetical protein
MEQQSVTGLPIMKSFLRLIRCAFAGILVSSCAQNPQVAQPAYGSASGTAPRSAKHHHVALAQVSLHHPRVASEAHHKLLRPWNYSPAAAKTPAPANAPTSPDHLPTDPHVSTPPHTLEIGPPHYWRWQGCADDVSHSKIDNLLLCPRAGGN